MTREEFHKICGEDAQSGVLYKKEANRSIKLSDKATLSISVTLYHTFRVAGYMGINDEENWSYDTYFTLTINGVTDKTSSFYPTINFSDAFRKKANMSPEAVSYLDFGSCGKFQFVSFTKEKTDIINNAIQELKDEVSTAESVSFFLEKQDREDYLKFQNEIESDFYRIKYCEKVIKEGETTLSNGRKLLKNLEEQKQWLRNYNNVMNEGGEGYVPEPPITEKQFQDAKNELIELKNKNFNKMGEGGAQPNISKEKIVSTPFPLPPLAEQKRIVAKLEELLPLCERLK